MLATHREGSARKFFVSAYNWHSNRYRLSSARSAAAVELGSGFSYKGKATQHVSRNMAIPYLPYLLGAAFLSYATFKALAWALHPYFSPLRHVPGPPNPSLLYGNFKDIWKHDMGVIRDLWAQEYGTTFKFKGFFSVRPSVCTRNSSDTKVQRDRLYTLDPRAINHILTHSTEFTKPPMVTNNLSRILGEGLLVAEGDVHRKQRRIMNPAFGPAQIRELTPIFVEKSAKLRDVLQAQLSDDGAPAKIDVLSWLSRATLDIIGLAGFDYAFDALDGKENELNEAFAMIFRATESIPLFQMLQSMVPLLGYIVRPSPLVQQVANGDTADRAWSHHQIRAADDGPYWSQAH